MDAEWRRTILFRLIFAYCYASCYDLHLTASSQFSSFNTIPLSLFLTSQRTPLSHTCNIFLSLLILLSGDIKSNPGPVSRVYPRNMCIFNIRSFTNPLRYITIADLADAQNIGVFALTETWNSSNTTSTQLYDAIHRGFTFIITSRRDSCISS